MQATDEPPSWRGYLDAVEPNRICGWAQNLQQLDAVVLRVFDNGIPIRDVRCDEYRSDLKAAGMGEGCHGFSMTFPFPLAPGRRHVIEVRRADDGRQLQGSPKVLEAQIAAPPGEVLTTEPAPWRGRLDNVTRQRISGWAWDERTPEACMGLLILDNGQVIGRALANRFRGDLAAAGIGTGRHAFDFVIPGRLMPWIRHVVQVIGEADGLEIPGSPIVLEPSAALTADLESALADAVASLTTPLERQSALNFLAAQLERLLQMNGDAEACREAKLISEQLQRRWGIAAFEGGEVSVAARVLVIDDRVPVSHRDAGSVAILSHMQALKRLGYEVTFVASAELSPRAEARQALEALGVQCCCVPFYASVEEVLRRQNECFEVVYLHRVSNAALYLGLVRRFASKAHVVFSVADLHFVRLARQAKVLAQPELEIQSARVRQSELVAASMANSVVTHSVVEANLLRQLIKGCNVHVVPWSVAVTRADTPWNERRDICVHR